MLLFLQDGYIEGDLPEKVSCFNGVFYNYFSIGMVSFHYFHVSGGKQTLFNHLDHVVLFIVKDLLI